MPGDLWWNPAPLQAKLRRAFITSVAVARGIAEARKGKGVGIELKMGTGIAILRATGPLAHLYERGARPHQIQASGRRGGGGMAMRLADGNYVRGPIRHPGMRAKPAIRPAGAAWPAAFRAAAIRELF